jgi:hypothetical protein
MSRTTLPPVEQLPGLRSDGTGTAYSGDSTGQLDWSLFDAKLLAHNIALRATHERSDARLHPNRCGPCADCRNFTGSHRSTDHTATVAAYVRHARRFGSECVADTARAHLTAAALAELQVDLAAFVGSNGAARQRHTTTALREQVEALARRGLMPSAIADTLHIGDRRVAAILASRPTPEIGTQKRLG